MRTVFATKELRDEAVEWAPAVGLAWSRSGRGRRRG
jgi:hypothetical protein